MFLGVWYWKSIFRRALLFPLPSIRGPDRLMPHYFVGHIVCTLSWDFVTSRYLIDHVMLMDTSLPMPSLAEWSVVRCGIVAVFCTAASVIILAVNPQDRSSFWRYETLTMYCGRQWNRTSALNMELSEFRALFTSFCVNSRLVLFQI